MDSLTWFAMCDRKRRNAAEPAYQMLKRRGFEVFTPMRTTIVGRGKNRHVIDVPFIVDLLFVHSTRQLLDPVEEVTPTLHYRFKRGGKYREALTVREDDMNRFIHAVNNAEVKEFFAIDALPPHLMGKTVVVHGGPLDGYQVVLKKMQGARHKRILVDLPGLAYAELELKDFDSIETVSAKPK